MQIYVSTFRLENYPVREEDILHTGVEAFAAALNTVNIGKFNLCTCSIGMVEHAFYEAITHAQNRILYGNPVTDFAHVRANFVDSYARLVAMKLFSHRSVDYLRSASLDDRRYLLFNPVTKAKVTMEGETIVRSLHDVVAAKGYEKNTMTPALLIRMSMGRPSALRSSPSAATLSSDDRSRLLIVSLASGTVARIYSTATSPLVRLRMAITTSAPAADNRVARPRPRPELEPVTTASFPDRSGTVTVSWRAMKITPCRWITEP